MTTLQPFRTDRILPRQLRKLGQLQRRLTSGAFIDFGDPRRTVLLSGVGRSGTTWVGDVLNHDNAYRAMFEPFHPDMVPALKGLVMNQYLREDEGDARLVRPVEAVLAGRVRHYWIDRYNRKRVATQRLIKDIRAGFMVAWIKRHVPEIPIVLLLRHPCAVANSRLTLGWQITSFKNILSQDALMADHLEPFRELMETVRDPFDKHVLWWCIQNYVALRGCKQGEVHVVFYEHFCEQPEEAAARVFDYLKRPMNIDKFIKVVKKPSALSRRDSAVVRGRSLTESWRRSVSREQVARATTMLRLFGLDHLYGEEPMPLGEDVTHDESSKLTAPGGRAERVVPALPQPSSLGS